MVTCGSAGPLRQQSYCWSICRELIMTQNFSVAWQKPTVVIASDGQRQEIVVSLCPPFGHKSSKVLRAKAWALLWKAVCVGLAVREELKCLCSLRSVCSVLTVSCQLAITSFLKYSLEGFQLSWQVYTTFLSASLKDHQQTNSACSERAQYG